ncbi:Mitochondrial copper homeostasis protein [Linnemannia hyalina]|uniref:Mitochondrial copper homeostasis protein n=1 Tax=Linnemannia hyalina TaxID=64524 RepID=A0A9P7Y328_9FUNG|nr:Mitochondrial copper homeostasis protein [Linnemannia hyalina]
MSTESRNTTDAGDNQNGTTNPQGAPRPPQIRRHDRIVTSDDEMKEFNKGYYAKAQSQYLDPCQAQTKASMKCMDANGFDKKKCTKFFKDYSDCKRKWLETLREDRRKRNLGIMDDDDIMTPEIKKESASTSS